MTESAPRTTSQQALLLRVVEDLAEIKAEIKADRAYQQRIQNMLDDHETRVRSLEQARHQTAWITAAASAGLTAFVVFVINNLLGA